MSKGFQKAFDDAAARGETRCSVCLSSAHSKEYHENAAEYTASTASQAPSQGGLPPYTPAASGGALSVEQVRLAFKATDEEQPINFWACFADRLNAALAAHDQRPQVSGASPVCLDCNKAGIRNCSNFDNCDGTWVYKPDAAHDQKVREDNRYAAYANHCAIQHKVAMTFYSWKKSLRSA